MPVKQPLEKNKIRKVPVGPIYNKARTKQKILDAVGNIFVKHGYSGLKISRIATEAKVDKKLIYTYFGSLKKLTAEYIESKEFWRIPGNEDIAHFIDKGDGFNKNDIFTLLQNQFKVLNTSKEYQKIILWEISEKNKLMQDIINRREEIGELLFKVIDKQFKGTGIDLRAIIAILIGGIYYMNLHAQVNGGTCCGIDIRKKADKQRIIEGIRNVIDMSYGV